MTRKSLIFRGLAVVAIVWGAVFAGRRWLESRDLTGAWEGRTTGADGQVWDASLFIRKDSGRWTGSFLHTDPEGLKAPCGGWLELQSSEERRFVFREHESSCADGAAVRAELTDMGLQVFRDASDGQPARDGLLVNQGVRVVDPVWAEVSAVAGEIRVGQTVQGDLGSEGPTTFHSGRVDTYRYVGEPGTPVVFRLRTPHFQPRLTWRVQAGPRWTEPEGREVDTMAIRSDELRLEVVPRSQGVYGITVYGNPHYTEKSGIEGEKMGPYTLTAERGTAAGADPRGARSPAAGASNAPADP